MTAAASNGVCESSGWKKEMKDEGIKNIYL